MVLDTSAIVAILLDEPERPAFDRLIEDDPQRLVFAITRVEATFVIESRKGEPGRERLERFS
jgi:ribonuclease VapC